MPKEWTNRPHDEVSPKDTFITVYGRMPVLEVLQDESLTVDKLVIADNARGENLDRIIDIARRQNITIQGATPNRVKLLAGNGKQDQGIIADVIAPRMQTLQRFLGNGERAGGPSRVLVLDGISNPSNVGMILRTSTSAGNSGIVLPRVGTPDVGPLVIKASAGVAFKAPILRCRTAVEALESLKDAGYRIYGLSSRARRSVFDLSLARRSAFVLGNETEGISHASERLVDEWISIPMANGVESLNVASAAAVLCFEIVRQDLERPRKVNDAEARDRRAGRKR